MNWFVSEPVSADSLLQAGLPFLEFLGVLVGIVAVLMLLIALLHTIFAVRSPNAHLELHRFGEAKRRVDLVLAPPAPPRKRLLQVAHLRGWLFTR
ncbi:MAG TPA: hypothetical protein VEV17_22300 [Bryobacteraceae bacterium]|nr:hypothetical protein [Bryobacteraceae bacterium]